MVDCDYNIEVFSSGSRDMPISPYVTFKLVQFKPTHHLMTDSEIDDQVDSLIESVENLRKAAKKKLKEARPKI